MSERAWNLSWAIVQLVIAIALAVLVWFRWN